MKFVIAETKDKMSFGDLFFTRPHCGESALRFKDFEAYCKKRAKEEFGDNELIAERLEAELDMIAQTGSTVTFEIVAEIAKLSRENGYPVCLFGEESGLIVMYLLGVSGIHPGQYDFSKTPTELYLHDVLEHSCVNITLAIAEPIRDMIVPQLNREFGSIRCSNDDYLNIHLPPFDVIEKIGRLSQATKCHYSEIYLNDPRVLFDVQCDICEGSFEWENNCTVPETALDVARYYAFARCNTKPEKFYGLFRDVQKRIFRDSVFEELVSLGMEKFESYDLSNLFSKEPQREAEIEKLKEAGASRSLVFVFEMLGNLWCETACLSRVNAMVMLKYYEINYPAEYERNA